MLGRNIVYLALAGLGFAALAGLGLGLILDNFNRERKRECLGWALLILGLPLFVLGFVLGLP